MSLSEFKLISQYFTGRQADLLGHPMVSESNALGDDCAIVQLQAGYDLLVTTDTMVENSHFYPEVHPYDLGYKAVTTNLSDVVSKGGVPTWVSLSITLPQAHPTWLEAFSAGLFDALNTYNVKLIGGDTVKGKELSVTITAQGTVPTGKALRRDQAKVGDRIYITGTIGGAYLGFKLLEHLHQKEVAKIEKDKKATKNQLSGILSQTPAMEVGISTQGLYKSERFPLITSKELDLTDIIRADLKEDQEKISFYHDMAKTLLVKNLHPQVLLKFVQRFHGYVNACMDISDGLASDLRHILELSRVNARVDLSSLPMHPYIAPFVAMTDMSKLLLPSPRLLTLKGGEDYQLLFTVPAEKVAEFHEVIQASGLIGMIHQIGEITPATEKQLRQELEATENLAVGSNFTPNIEYTQNGEVVDIKKLVEADILSKTNDPAKAQEASKFFQFEHFLD
ncbi:thiamine-phosphate kinase [Psittacicella hinzii]|uniref:Thiamine-monophosphate kinase n=1 Tax=Psittacicella hinzii TaxID=2028575 RepID=A0A3A1Y7Y5_9GAMM|nr:thiamine-phosphate kinase [Psittacicella hinzii]RIY33339.1 thiamine-phosphate kinase [Psittacicella hinzii]